MCGIAYHKNSNNNTHLLLQLSGVLQLLGLGVLARPRPRGWCLLRWVRLLLLLALSRLVVPMSCWPSTQAGVWRLGGWWVPMHGRSSPTSKHVARVPSEAV